MIDRSVQIRYKESPVLLDKVLQDMQQSLLERLPWLDKAFGRAYKLVRHESDGNKNVYPATYIGKGEYASLEPNDQYGNFCWFDIYDPQKITPVVQSMPQYTFEGAIVFWYDLSTIYNDDSVLYTEDVKDEIMRVLTAPGLIKTTGKMDITNIYERFDNIYSGYSIEKVYNNYIYAGSDIQDMDKQYFMYPYAGLRIEFTLTTRELCQRYIM